MKEVRIVMEFFDNEAEEEGEVRDLDKCSLYFGLLTLSCLSLQKQVNNIVLFFFASHIPIKYLTVSFDSTLIACLSRL